MVITVAQLPQNSGGLTIPPPPTGVV